MPKKSSEANFIIDRNYIENPIKIGKNYLFQVGRKFCTPNESVPVHLHREFIELTAVKEGRGIIYTNGIPVKVSSGDIYISFPGDFHSIKSSEHEPLKYDFITLKTEDGDFHSEIEKIYRTFGDPKTRIIKNDHIDSLISMTIYEMNRNNIMKNEMLNSILTEIFIYIIREFDEISIEKKVKNITDNEVICYFIMNYIDTHIYTLKNLTELSEVSGYTYNYLSNLFKKVTGDTILSYYKKRRMETARLLFAEDGMNITHVAELLGYSSPYALSRAIKETYGISPKELIKDKNSKWEYGKILAERVHIKVEKALSDSTDIFDFFNN